MINKLKRIIRRLIQENSDILSSELFGLTNDSYNVLKMARLRAASASADYYNLDMSTAIACKTKHDLLRRSMSLRATGGLVLEFGVASGEAINLLAENTTEKVFGFDSFEGLPDDWRTGYTAGRRTTFPHRKKQCRVNQRPVRRHFANFRILTAKYVRFYASY